MGCTLGPNRYGVWPSGSETQADDEVEPDASVGSDASAGSDTVEVPDQFEGGSGGTDSEGDESTTVDSSSSESTGTTTSGGEGCGNGVIDIGEQCDGGNLGGISCLDLGYSGGALACDPVTCTYDASGCTIAGTASGTSG